MEASNIEEKQDSKAWLQKLKEESWEAELLISTVAIFGTVQMFKLVDLGVIYFIDKLAPQDYLFGLIMIFMSLLAVSVLLTMFIIHFMLRAYWVGLVGLNSVFPDYNLEDSPYSKIYTHKMSAILPKLKHTIQDIDDLCSVIFSAAFSVFSIYGYITVLGLLFFGIYNNTKEFIPREAWVSLAGIMVILSYVYIAILIIANIKRFKENVKVQNLFFFVVKWSNLIIMGPLYKYMLQVNTIFATNFKKKKSLIWLLFTFVAVGFLVSQYKLYNSKSTFLLDPQSYSSSSKLYSNSYANTADKEAFLLGPQIESDVVERSLMKLFIPIYSYEDELCDRLTGVYIKSGDLERDAEREIRRKWHLDRRVNYHEIQLNDRDITVDFIGYNLPNTGQYGLLGYVNLQGGVAQEKNELRIRKELEDNESEWTIPFHYIESK